LEYPFKFLSILFFSYTPGFVSTFLGSNLLNQNRQPGRLSIYVLYILWKFCFLQCIPRSFLRHSTPFYCPLAHFTLHLLCVLPFKNAMLLLLSSSPLLLLLLGLRFSLCRCFCLCLCLLLCSFGRCFNCFIRRFFFFAAPFGWAGAQAVCAEYQGGAKRVQGPIQCLLLLLLMLLLSLLRRRCSNII